MPNDPAGKAEAANGAAGGADPSKAASNGDAPKKNGPVGLRRCFFVFQVLVGYEVEVKLNDGSAYRGIFSSIGSDRLVLRMARLVRDASGADAPRATFPEPTKAIPMADWADIIAIDVRMGSTDVGAAGAGDDAGGFGTDAAISRGRGAASGRDLERWTPGVDESQLMHLEESVTNTARGWDQFALNERKFGVRTDYHEELYTTALDPTKSRISVAEAERLAAEIERGNKNDTTRNLHLMEERGMEIDDGDMDEEDRYGAVIRDAPPGAGGRGGGRGAPPPPPRPAGAWGRGAPTAPISIDSRREANKVRAQMTAGGGGKAASPYGTPKQLASPLVGDAQKLAALNLDPGVARMNPGVLEDFKEFKNQQQGGAAGAAGGNGSRIAELRQFSEQMDSKLPKKAGEGAAGAEAAKKSSNFSLNPNAKSFNFNINAKEFTPTFTPKAAAPSAPAPAAMRPAMPPMPRDGDGAGPPYPRKREDGGGDYRRGPGGDRRHHDSRPTPPYGDGGHGRSPPSAGMPMAAMAPGMMPGMMGGHTMVFVPGMAGPGGMQVMGPRGPMGPQPMYMAAPLYAAPGQGMPMPRGMPMGYPMGSMGYAAGPGGMAGYPGTPPGGAGGGGGGGGGHRGGGGGGE